MSRGGSSQDGGAGKGPGSGASSTGDRGAGKGPGDGGSSGGTGPNRQDGGTHPTRCTP